MQNHHDMLADSVRMNAFIRAISIMVRKSDAVLDAGAGTGVMAVAAALAGARKVYAVEKQSVIDIGKRLAEENGCADRMEFIKGDVREIELPEPVDGIICEMIAPAGVGEGIAEVIEGARERLMKKGGWTIPASMTVFAAPVCYTGLYDWIMLDVMPENMKVDSLRDELSQFLWAEDLYDSRFPSAPQKILEIDFARVRADRRAPDRGNAVFTVARDCELHGMGIWFSAVLAPGVDINSSPDNPRTHWRQAFFPLRKPMGAAAGDEIAASLQSFPASEGDIFYIKMEQFRNGLSIRAATMSNALAPNIINTLRVKKNADRRK